jgi:uncharacterized membrane protein
MSDPEHPARGTRLATRTLVMVAGVYHLALGAFMVAAPKTFYDKIGPFGPYNDHYVRDNATFYIALGIALLVAVARVRWQVPLLALAALQYAVHVLNHIWDIDDADPTWVGPVDAVALALIGLFLWWLMREADRRQPRRPASGERSE